MLKISTLESLEKGHPCACAVPSRQFKFSICKIQACTFPALCQDAGCLSPVLFFAKGKDFMVCCLWWQYQMTFSSAMKKETSGTGARKYQKWQPDPSTWANAVGALDLLALAGGHRGHWHLQGPQTAGNAAKGWAEISWQVPVPGQGTCLESGVLLPLSSLKRVSDLMVLLHYTVTAGSYTDCIDIR